MWERMTHCVRLAVFLSHVFFFFIGVVLIAVGTWLVADRFEISELLGTYVYIVFVIFTIIAGLAITFVSFLAWYGALKESRGHLRVYAVVTIVLIVVLLCVVLMALIFRFPLGNQMRLTMEETIVQRYEFQLNNNTLNRVRTTMWDAVQRKLNCCAVDDHGWAIYKRSNWFLLQGSRPASQKQYVPRSCCRLDYYTGLPLNMRYCQNLQSAPPNVDDGATNRFLHYDGCYKKAYDMVSARGWVIFGFGLFALLAMIVSVIMTCWIMRNIKQDKDEKEMMMHNMAMAQQGGDAQPMYAMDAADKHGYYGQQPMLDEYGYPMSGQGEGEQAMYETGDVQQPVAGDGGGGGGGYEYSSQAGASQPQYEYGGQQGDTGPHYRGM